MTIEDLTQLMSNKLSAAENARNVAYMAGDIAAYDQAQKEIDEIQKILDKLKS